LANIGQKQPLVQERPGNPEEEARTPAAPTQLESKLIDFDLLDLMLETANHVGHSFHKDTREWEAVRKLNKPFTVPGKRMNKSLESLKSLYDQLRDLIATKNLDGIQGTHIEITNLVHSIKEETDRILTNRLGNPALGINYFDDISTRSLLTDLYFNILPKLLKAMILGAEVYAENGTIETSSLEELADLVEVHYRLAKAAIDQPKSSQPRQSQIPPEAKSIGFELIRPTQRVIPLMEDFRTSIKVELSSRAQAEKRRLARQRERKHREQERIQYQERRRRRNEIRKKQRADLARQLKDPIWGPILRDEIARRQTAAEATEALEELKKRRARRIRVVEPWMAGEEDVEDLFEDDPFEQRVSIFGKNNRQQNGAQPWSDKKMTVFVDFLRVHDGTVPCRVLSPGNANAS